MKGCDRDLLAVRTLFPFHLVFSHDQAQGEQIHQLSAFSEVRHDRVQIRLALFAPLHRLHEDLILRRRKMQG